MIELVLHTHISIVETNVYTCTAGAVTTASCYVVHIRQSVDDDICAAGHVVGTTCSCIHTSDGVSAGCCLGGKVKCRTCTCHRAAYCRTTVPKLVVHTYVRQCLE